MPDASDAALNPACSHPLIHAHTKDSQELTHGNHRYEHTWGSTTSDETQLKVGYDYQAAPYTKVKCTMLAKLADVLLPYTMTFNDGSKMSGNLRIKKALDVQYEVAEVEKYDA